MTDLNTKVLDNSHIYQSFFFENKIKEFFYSGNSFLEYGSDMKQPELLDLAYDIIDEGEAGFMPKLVDDIQSLLGEGNYVYDMWEFGPDSFSLYWWICKDVYLAKMALIGKWVAFNQLEDLVDYRVKNAEVS